MPDAPMFCLEDQAALSIGARTESELDDTAAEIAHPHQDRASGTFANRFFRLGSLY